MLQITDICKQYKTGNFIQKALNHVSLNLRDNEFVAILGHLDLGKLVNAGFSLRESFISKGSLFRCRFFYFIYILILFYHFLIR